MTRNPERRTALVDAAIEVLAREGARGLTFRAVDAQAGVPAGTASNYFASRDDLFTQAGSRIHVRMTPAPAAVDEAMRPAPSRELVAELMRWLVRRMTEERTGYLALLELRLEATRRPALRAELDRAVRSALEENVRFHLDAGLPGDADTVLVLYLAMTGLLVEHFTLPGVLSGTALDDLVEKVVARIVPAE
ncbi:TetR/AcrR family transcriptional regulator [Streptomyces thermolineatus]|uniref:TetR/AcrR family transcriptional regulator n=1 Tax=Streptomyces thermolineatus TaxID=44033 RepID=A0ABN3L5G5_9ACTN|nr:MULTISPECIES: TetR/AcrR family transcriptional regulator [unclassified Streptomyces]MCZ2525130.1 TetR family transcriptional regulator [Streptomyces sp. HB2AG]PLW74656.1 TetR family transcriptional regulator [Streptomyces sp. DJ]QMV22535.1 TetR family transcriptional regulator [Streptomyces sp. SCUT-3]